MSGFIAEASPTLRAESNGYQTYPLLNPYDDGIGLTTK